MQSTLVDAFDIFLIFLTDFSQLTQLRSLANDLKCGFELDDAIG